MVKCMKKKKKIKYIKEQPIIEEKYTWDSVYKLIKESFNSLPDTKDEELNLEESEE